MNHAVQTLTIVATAALSIHRGVTVAGAVPGAGAAIAGFTRTAGAIGDPVPVDTLGTTLAETGGAVAAGAAVEVDNQGRVVTLSTGTKVGRMAPGQAAAGGAGAIVEIVLIPN